MSILIKGMKMPASCRRCDFSQPDGCGFFCPITTGKPVVDSLTHNRHARCPLVAVPPHGRLIDEKDAIKSTWMVLKGLGYYGLGNPGLTETVKAVFKTAPAIIEAEEGE